MLAEGQSLLPKLDTTRPLRPKQSVYFYLLQLVLTIFTPDTCKSACCFPLISFCS